MPWKRVIEDAAQAHTDELRNANWKRDERGCACNDDGMMVWHYSWFGRPPSNAIQWYRHPTNERLIAAPCITCPTEFEGYAEMSSGEVMKWWAQYHTGRDSSRSQQATSRDAAHSPAVQ